MKTCAITIQPLSPFGTPLKGDTLFGQFCWQCASDPALLNQSFDVTIAAYGEKPFALFSSAFPVLPDGSYALKRPEAPLEMLHDLTGMSRDELLDNRKRLKGKKWLLCRHPDLLKDLRTCEYHDNNGISKIFGLDYDRELLAEVEISHNSINRLTGTTGEGFAPFTCDSLVYAPECRLVIFAAFDENVLSVENLKTGLQRIGSFGYGRDATTGLGRFALVDCTTVDLAALGAHDANALYTLAPSVPETGRYRDAMFTPFTRFGRHGDCLAVSGKPYKNPVIMVDEGALLFPNNMAEALNRPYLGTGIIGISKIQENTVHQGYALYIPVRLEAQ